MPSYDPNKVRTLAANLLPVSMEAGEGPGSARLRSELAEVRLAELLEAVRQSGVDISSLTGEEWDNLLGSHGMDADEIASARESIASWAITDKE